MQEQIERIAHEIYDSLDEQAEVYAPFLDCDSNWIWNVNEAETKVFSLKDADAINKECGS